MNQLNITPICFDAALFFLSIIGALACVWIMQATLKENRRFKDLQRFAFMLLAGMLFVHAFVPTAILGDFVVMTAILTIVIMAVRSMGFAKPKQPVPPNLPRTTSRRL